MDARFSRPKAEVQSPLLGIVDVAIEDEGVDSLEPRRLDPAVAVTGRLQRLAVGAVGRVESLFGKDDPPRLAVAEHFRTAKVGGQLFKVFEGDLRSVGVRKGRFVEPRARIEQVGRIRMVGHVPVEVASHLREPIHLIEKSATGAGAERITIPFCGPVMLERDVNPRVGRMSAHGRVGHANGGQVFAGDLIQGGRPDRIPFAVRVYFVSDDVADDAAESLIRSREPLGQHAHAGLEIRAPFRIHHIKAGNAMWHFLGGRGTNDPAQPRIAGRRGQENQCDLRAGVGERL